MLRTPTLELLKYASFPALAAGLTARIESIMKRWQLVVCEKLPTADELTFRNCEMNCQTC